MSVYLITYDLSAPRRDYAGVLEKIKTYDFAKLTESAYAVSTTETLRQVKDKVRQAMDSDDTIYVIGPCESWAGYGPKKTNAWLDEHL